MSTSDRRIAVIGLGNPLMGDDGLGLVALKRAETEWRFDDSVELIDGGTWGLSLLPIIESATHVLLIDAIRSHVPAGTLVMLLGEDVPRMMSTKLSPHQIDVRELLALAELRGTLPKHLIALGIQPESVEVRHALSYTVAQSLDQLIAIIVDRLRVWGVRCTPTLAEVA
jgi:hydrogenase maturation protease